MGFRKNSYCTVWDVSPKTDTRTVVRISISRKNKDTDEYEQDFSGFVSFVGSSTAKNAICLKKGDRIKLGDVDVTTRYYPEKETTYVNYTCFNFETLDQSSESAQHTNDPQPMVDDGDVDDELPF